MRSPRQPYTEDDRQALRNRFDRWSRRMTRERGRFFKKELLTEFGIGANLMEDDSWLLEPFHNDGTLVSMGCRRGYARTGESGSSTTLAELVAFAESRKDDSLSTSGGPRDGRRVSTISAGQFARIEQVARLVAEALTGDKQNWQTVTSENWSWDPGLHGGDGDWVVTERVAEWSDVRSRRKKSEKGKPWTPADNTGRSNHVASARLLLDLAATHGVIEREGTHGPEHHFHAAEWAPVVERWLAIILERNDGKSAKKVRGGVRALARYATQFGFLSPAETDWPSIRKRLASDHDRGSLSYDQMNWARHVYRHLIALGEITAPEWPVKQSNRVSLVATAQSHGAAATGDFGGWMTLDGRPLAGCKTGLVESAYGIRAWRRWATASRQGELRANGLPERKWPEQTATAQQKRKIARKPDFLRLSPSVVESRLFGLNLYAGFLAREYDIDWTQEDLRTMTDPAHVERFGQFLGLSGSGGRNESSVAAETFFALATIASPFLEAVAWQREEEGIARLMHDRAADLTVTALEWQLDEDVKDKRRIEQLWNVTGDGGWETLILLRDAMVDEIVRRGDGLTLEEQIAALRSGAKPWGERWAKLGQLAVLVTVARNVPLRLRAFCALDNSMWKNYPAGKWTGREPTAQTLQPWEGAIQLVVPGEAMKTGRSYAPWLMSPAAVGEPEAEARLQRPLLELYFMSRGMRDELLSVCEYTCKKGRRVVKHRETYTSHHIFPGTVRRMRLSNVELEKRQDNDGFRYDGEALSVCFSSNVLQYGPRIGLDASAMDEEWGCTTLHAIRLLFGTYWAPRQLKYASLMLGHANTTITETMYCAADETCVDLDALEAEAGPPRVAVSAANENVEDIVEARARELADEMLRERFDEFLQRAATGGLSAA